MHRAFKRLSFTSAVPRSPLYARRGGTVLSHVKGTYFSECERDEGGQCLPKGESGGGKADSKPKSPITENIESNSKLSPEQKKAYAAGMEEVMSRVPEAAHKLIKENLKGANFYPDTEELISGLWDSIQKAIPVWLRVMHSIFTSKEGRRLEKKVFALTHRTAAAYFPTDGTLHLDGDAPTNSVGAGTGKRGLNHAQVYAHEIGHVLDGPDEKLSKDPAWEVAWKREIAKEGHPLTRYAAKKQNEGLAEFSRLLYGGGVDLAEVERMFPSCTRFFKKRNLWPV